ncbi:hypothetical protein [Bradyrhizobium sp. SEMIA]|uniref:hypothetical protein n=1 Tax=Bradyrhizobium sp. SEMIA TaxID=2597515 RepID=UPI0018A3F8A5|nr:hypothetical protein [Bradyrhizobium sp. SEMIA]QOG19142.1 hypothetical protein FOM02_19105 [Bradyrhizobium sp. SEMIA]
MARFRCAACRREGECEYDGNNHRCPLCGSPDVVFALAIEELPDAVLDAINSAEPLDDHPDEEDR